jgi:hypothetical protein
MSETDTAQRGDSGIDGESNQSASLRTRKKGQIRNRSDPLFLPAAEATDDIVVEVFIRGESKHRASSLVPPCEETITGSGRIEATFILATNVIGKLPALDEIRVDFVSVIEVVADNGINVRKPQAWVLLDDAFWG